MTTYTYPKDKIKKIAIRRVLSILPLIIIVLIGSLSVASHFEDKSIKEEPAQLYIMLGVGLFVVLGGLFTSIKTIFQILKDTKYVLSDNSIKKQIPNGNNIEIFYKEIRSSYKTNRGILIKAEKKQFIIPATLANFKEIERKINTKTFTAIQHLDTKFKINDLVLKYVVGIIFMLMLVSFFFFDNKIKKLSVGIPLLFVFAYALYNEYKNEKSSYLSMRSIVKMGAFCLMLFSYLLYIAFT